MTNCPNCGAPITGPVCEYCETRLYALRSSGYSSREEYERCSAEVELLKAKTKLMHEQRVITDIYAEALIAMRAYSSGVCTPNELRAIAGLERR